MKVTLNELLLLDDQLSSRLRMQPGKNRLWYLMAFSAHSGDPWYWMLAFALVFLFGDYQWKMRAAVLFISTFLLGMVTTILKYLFRRSRPPGTWGTIYRTADPHSFPSGHAARSAMLAVLGIGMGPAWLAIILILHAPLVIFSRVSTGVHFLSDVVAGMAVGIIFGLVILVSEPLIVSIVQHLMQLYF